MDRLRRLRQRLVARFALAARLAFVVAAGVLLASAAAGAERIVGASYAEPVERYGHFALGRPHEYARLAATTDAGRRLEFRLPDDEVFEDVAPRVVRFAAGEAPEILAIVSARGAGSRLVTLRLVDGRLDIGAQSAAIGTPMRWLNPVGVADLDGDGRAEIAAVVTPHIGGTLKVYRRHGRRLVEVAALAGFSNHVYGTAEQALSMPTSIFGTTRLLVPDASRRHLRVVALRDGRLVETGRCPLAEPLTGPLLAVSGDHVSVGLASGARLLGAADCPG